MRKTLLLPVIAVLGVLCLVSSSTASPMEASTYQIAYTDPIGSQSRLSNTVVASVSPNSSVSDAVFASIGEDCEFVASVTAVFSDRFYVQSLDRACGIAIDFPNAHFLEGDLVSVSGKATTIGAERAVRPDDTPTVIGSFTTKPVFTQARIINSLTGLRTQALLFKIAGKVTALGDGYVIVNDGSLPNSAESPGLKVLLAESTSTPPVGVFITAVGVSGCEVDGDVVTPVLRTRSAQDVPSPVISGCVRTPSGDPVASAQIHDGYYDISAETGDDGYYSIRVPWSWSGSLAVQVSNYVTDPSIRVYTNVVADQLEQNYTVIPYPVISGCVKTASGDPIQDVWIHAGDWSWWTCTAADGHYSAVVPYGWSGTIETWSDQWSTHPGTRVYENVTADLTGQDYVAVPHPVISGYVRTPDGAPVEGVQVHTDDWNWWAYTDSDGYYSLKVPYGWTGGVTTWLEHSTIDPYERYYENVTEDLTDQDYVAVPHPVISGYVRTADGAPVEGVQVYSVYGSSWDRYTWTNSDGYYSLEVPHGWTGTVKTRSDGWAFIPYERLYENVTTDLADQDYVAYPDPAISGHIRTADGAPVEGVYVRTDDWNRWAITDADGYYSMVVPYGWTGALRTSSELWATDPSERSYENVTIDFADQDFVALPHPVISGHIRTADGAPVEGASVYTDDGSSWIYTDSNGYYGLRVPRGWSGAVRTQANYWTIDPDQRSYENVTADLTDQDFVAYPHPVISGHVRTAGGAPVEGVQVYAVYIDGWGRYSLTDSDGYYSIMVPPGWTGVVRTWSGQWSTDPYERAFENVTADLAGQDYIAIPHPAISGHVRRSDGAPVEGVRVHTSDWDWWADTDSDGYYSLKVPYGWTGVVSTRSDEWSTDPCERAYDGVTADLTGQDYVAVPHPVISGYIRTADGVPVGGVELYTVVSDGWSRWAYTDSDGYYSLKVPRCWSGVVRTWSDQWATDPYLRAFESVTTDLPNQDYVAVPHPVISGCIKTAEGVPVEGVDVYIVYTDGWGWSSSTDSDGYYSLKVTYGWTGVVSTWSDQWATNPHQRAFDGVTADLANQDYVAIPHPVVSGYIKTADGVPVQGVQVYIEFPDGWNRWTCTNSDGYYSLKVTYGWTGVVRTWSYQWAINPAERLYENVTADSDDQNYTAAPK